MNLVRPSYVPEHLERQDTFRSKSYDGALLYTRWKDPQGNILTYPADSSLQIENITPDQELSSGLRRFY